MRRISFILVFIFFLFGIIGFFLYRRWQVTKNQTIPFIPQDSHITLSPPSKALSGKIVQITGEVEKLARDKEEFEKVTEPGNLLQGESIRTLRDSRVEGDFTDFASINLSPNSQIDFVSLMPDNFLLGQTVGNLNLKVSLQKTVSVRVLHSLVSISDGETIINNTQNIITIQVKSGRAKIALVDLANETHVYELEKGDKASIDDTNRRVEIY